MSKPSDFNLFEKYGNGTITDQELLQLHHWYLEYAKSSNPQLEPVIYEKRMKEMDMAVMSRLKPVKRSFFASPFLRLAALLLLAMGITFYLWNSTHTVVQHEEISAHDVAPGGNRAKLILADGKQIDLSGALNGELAKQAGVRIMKTSNGQLSYELTGDGSFIPEYNTIEIPKGGQYGVCLPDGTKVWLNAASTLKYPATFSSLSERRVMLSGEAYFEVAHDAKLPFIVQTECQSVRDIGTKFNINSYAEEPGIKTTLLEGSAAVSTMPTAGNIIEKIVKEGQQAVLTSEGIAVDSFHAEEAISWKNGYFQFQDEDIRAGMRQIERWYNVVITYEGSLPAARLDGKVYRNMKLSALLKILLGSEVSFTIEDRKVTIMSKNY